MNSAYPVDVGVGEHFGFKGIKLLGKLCLSLNEVYLGKELYGLQYAVGIWAQLVAYLTEYAYYLSLFLCLQLADAVVSLYYCCGLEEEGLARSRFIVYYTLYLALHGGLDGDDETPVAHGGCDVLIHVSLSLCRAQDGIESARDAALHLLLFQTYME